MTRAATSPSRRSRLQPRIESHLLQKLDALFAPAREDSAPANVELLHRMRVASRRLRVALRCFAPLFPDRELQQVQRHLRRLTRALGQIRTADIHLLLLRRAGRQLPASTEAARRKLTGEWLADRVRYREELDELLQAFRTSHFEERIRTMVLKPRPLDDLRLLTDARDFLADRRRAMRRRFKRCGPAELTGPAVHKFRLSTKRYRYACESCAEVMRLEPVERLRALEELQDRLGDCHDLDVLLSALRAARRRWDKAANPLAAKLEVVITFFQTDHAAAMDRCAKFLDTERLWLKKVKLRIPND